MVAENQLETWALNNSHEKDIDVQNLISLFGLTEEALAFFYYSLISLRTDTLRAYNYEDPQDPDRKAYLDYVLKSTTLLIVLIKKMYPESLSLHTHFSKQK